MCGGKLDESVSKIWGTCHLPFFSLLSVSTSLLHFDGRAVVAFLVMGAVFQMFVGLHKAQREEIKLHHARISIAQKICTAQ
jgi:hypothetical protein